MRGAPNPGTCPTALSIVLPGLWSSTSSRGDEEGDHGTRMFEAAPEVQDDLVEFYTGLR
jgi:hypothetical protein